MIKYAVVEFLVDPDDENIWSFTTNDEGFLDIKLAEAYREEMLNTYNDIEPQNLQVIQYTCGGGIPPLSKSPSYGTKENPVIGVPCLPGERLTTPKTDQEV